MPPQTKKHGKIAREFRKKWKDACDSTEKACFL
jgi:hypothetical protein